MADVGLMTRAASLALVGALLACSPGSAPQSGPATNSAASADPSQADDVCLSGEAIARENLANAALGVVDVLFRARVEDRSGSRLDAVVEEILWAADGHWNVRQWESFDPVGVATEFSLPNMFADADIPTGEALVLGTTAPREGVERVGYGQVWLAADTAGRLWPLADNHSRVVEMAADATALLGGDGHGIEALTQLLVEAHAVLDQLNRGRDPEPGELTKQVMTPECEPEPEGFADLDPGTRQLPMVLDEVPDLEQVLGRPIVSGEVDMVLPPGSADMPAYLGVRFVGSGVLGPVRIHADRAYGTLMGVFPTTGEVELFETAEPLGPETVHGRWTLPQWGGDERLAFVRDADGTWRMAVMTAAELDAEFATRNRQ